jgi:hypothetical protein
LAHRLIQFGGQAGHVGQGVNVTDRYSCPCTSAAVGLIGSSVGNSEIQRRDRSGVGHPAQSIHLG